MGKEVVYCVVCGERIPSADFEKGKAVTVLKRHYCRKCAKDLVEGVPEVTSVAISEPKPRTNRIPKADPPIRKWVPYAFAAGIGMLALALLVYVLFFKAG